MSQTIISSYLKLTLIKSKHRAAKQCLHAGSTFLADSQAMLMPFTGTTAKTRFAHCRGQTGHGRTRGGGRGRGESGEVTSCSIHYFT